MRDILFKAKAINRNSGYHRTNYKNGDWVYGLVTRLYDERFENLPAEMTDLNGVSGIEIDHNTICQYTGLTDKNGNKIWENDICDRKEKYPEVVKQYQGDWVLDCSYLFRKDVGYSYCNLGFYVCERKCIEVIGDIFDNPELIGE